MATAQKDFQLRVKAPPDFILTEDLARAIATEEYIPLRREIGPSLNQAVIDTALFTTAHGSSSYLTTGGPLPPAECPPDPTLLPAYEVTPGNPTWMALDTVLQKYCVIEENNSLIHFIDALTNTQILEIDLGGGSGAPNVVYDVNNAQFVIMNYDGDIIFVNSTIMTEISRLSGLIHHPEHGLLTIDPATSTVIATSYRDVTVTGKMYVINATTRTLTSSTSNVVAPDFITWCPNISKVYITYVGIGQPLYRLFDPISHAFTSSALTHTYNFNYECWYDENTGYVLQSQDGSHPSLVVNVSTDSIVGSIEPTRLASVVANTCTFETWASNGNDKIYVLNTATPATKHIYPSHPNGLGFSRQSGLVTFTDYSSNQIIPLSGVWTYDDILGISSFGNMGGITALTINQPITLGGYDIEGDTELTSISWPFLCFIDPQNNQNGYIFIDGCTGLTTISMPHFFPTPGGSYAITGAALSAASVNAFLHQCVLNPNFTSGSVDLSGGTSSAPTGAGITDKATLIGLGVSVTTN